MGSTTSKTTVSQGQITLALQNGEVDFLRKHMDHEMIKSNISYKNNQTGLLTSASPLHISAEFGCTECVEYLIGSSADIHNVSNSSRDTPLHCAVMASQKKCICCIKLLLMMGANINALNIWKRTPLMKAVVNFKFAAAKYLIKEGADVNIGDENGTTPLIVAANYNNTEICSYLLKCKADINAQDLRGRTALYFAILGCHDKMSEFLLRHGSDANICDEIWGSPLQLAITKCNVKIMKLLLEDGVQTGCIKTDKSPSCIDMLLKIVNKRVNVVKNDENASACTLQRALDSLHILILLITSAGIPIQESIMNKINGLVSRMHHRTLHEAMLLLHKCASRAFLPKGNNPTSLQQIARHRCRQLLMNSNRNIIWACNQLDVMGVVTKLVKLEL